MRLFGAVAAVAGVLTAGPVGSAQDVVLGAGAYSVHLNAATGAISGIVRTGSSESLLCTGSEGLWRARLMDGTIVDAASCRDVQVRRLADRNSARIEYRAAAINVAVDVRAAPGQVELTARVTAQASPVVAFDIPARMRFKAAAVRRFICPSDGNQSVGMSLSRSFFLPQPTEEPSAWAPVVSGAGSYARLFVAPLVQRPDLDPPVPLTVTDQGREWLGSAADVLNGMRAVVNRPPARTPDLSVLVDSANGPWLSAVSLGQGRAWRIGGSVGTAEAPMSSAALTAVTAKLARSAPAHRRTLGVIALRRAPDRGGWTDVGVRDWIERLKQVGDVDEIETTAELALALRSESFAVILNPYGEWCPTLPGAHMAETVDAVAAWVRAGGNWIETGGYPFFYALAPATSYRYGGRYPAMFADFMHLDSDLGSASVYRIQAPSRAPWAAASDHASIFVPGELYCGSDESGAYLERTYAPVVRTGQAWMSPVTRIALGGTPEAGISQYCRANGITRRLAEKMPAKTLDQFRRSVLLYCSGSAKSKLGALDRLPRPTLVHFADYLRGGFDRQYPDHLPPNADFGTMSDLKRIAHRCRRLGLLWMPYTNPTWWCDHPRGPTFESAGDAPLLRDLAGKPIYERYGDNDGWTVCFWHPAVRAANRKTVGQFTKDVPVDILFQDQCGARGWSYDTNPASPAAHAYVEGLLSMVAEDSRDAPLSTESGWDRVAQYESQLCGMTWALVPTEHAPEWRRLLRESYPPDAWTVYPLAQRIAHDKCSMVHHDLGQFVTNDEVLAWTLGLGFGLSYAAPADALKPQAGASVWLAWLDRLQKQVCARYVGEGVRQFSHVRPRPAAAGTVDDGVIRAAYGSVRLASNLSSSARLVDGRDLAPHGFWAQAPGVVAGRLASLDGLRFDDRACAFVTSERTSGAVADLWIYGPTGHTTAVVLPTPVSTAVTVTFDGLVRQRAEARKGVVRIRVPAAPDVRAVVPPPDLAGKAPRDWPGTRPAIGVIDLGSAVTPTWTRIKAADWLRALRESRLARTHGVPITALTDARAVTEALQAGPRRWLVIVNPYGEAMPTLGPGRWPEAIDSIRAYVAHGGCWWETGGYSHHVAVYRVAGSDVYGSEQVGPAGAARLGIRVGGGPVDATPVPLRVTALGNQVLGAQLAAEIESLTSPVNRSLAADDGASPYMPLVTGGGQDYVGGYRLGGWGWYWRIGGFWPIPDAALPVVVATIEKLFEQPTAAAPVDAHMRLTHAVVTWPIVSMPRPTPRARAVRDRPS